MRTYYDASGYAVYPPRRAFSLTLIPALVALLFAVVGVVIRILSGDPMTLLLPLFAFVLYGLVLLTVAAIGYSYRLGDRDLILRNTFSRARLPLSGIAAVHLLDQAQAAEFLAQLEMPWVQATRASDFSRWGRTLKRNAELLRYMSVPLVTSSTSVGSKRNIVKFKALSRGSYLLIETTDGRMLALTPKDAEGLYDELRARGAAAGDPNGIVAAEKERAERIEEERKGGAAAGFIRIYRIVALCAAAAIALTAVGFFIVKSREPAPTIVEPAASPAATPEPAAPVYPAERPEAGWLDGNTLRVRVDSTYWPNEDQSREARISEMRSFGELGAEWEFAQFIAKGYAERNGIEPKDMRWDQGIQALHDWAQTLPRKLIHEDLGERLRFGKFVYEFSAPGIREEAERRFGAFR